ncbi:TPA: hypothetical protein ACHF2V_001453 [Citrobacter farmeri]|uniref:hypothetical protein n=1 Tax=Citrobacter farmeri TaxID=67824 RepID=UPI0005101A5D|nr:hypothetical protein [Citrobacter farmeri]QXA95688.1 hypothetical protein I6L53_13655 [Citrobacter farmeri]GAL49103.1 hypothetical protein CIFAM_06_05180 [Citrobacter farmeri GTC 1319]
MNKIQILSLAFCLSITGCKEAEIKGEWTGATNDLNAGLMRSLFLDAKVNINDENISVSESENEGGTTTFLVTIGDKKHSKEWIEATLKKVKQLQYEKIQLLTSPSQMKIMVKMQMKMSCLNYLIN